MNHEEFEIAVEKKRRNQLTAEELARLKAHLKQCAQCRQFEASSQTEIAAMTANVNAIEMSVDLGSVGTFVSKAKRTIRVDLVVYIALVGLLAFAAGSALVYGDTVSAAVVGVPTLLVFIMGSLTYLRLRRAKHGDPVAFVRKELTISIRRNREYQALALLYAWANATNLLVLAVVVVIVATIEMTNVRKLKRGLAKLQ